MWKKHRKTSNRNISNSAVQQTQADASKPKNNADEQLITNKDVKNVQKCINCCEEYSVHFPYSFNIFLPGTKEVIKEFIISRHRLTTSGLRCRLRMGLNTFDSGCKYGKERVLRLEGMTKEEIVSAVDLLDNVFPDWKVWKRGKSDAELL
ncbi:unnamed protein product [Trichobilharzia szidati]|nr:unnamed protein product [Trichobilharzia szidati]